MSEEMKFKNGYQDTFNEVHAPADLSRKVMNLANTEKKRTAGASARKWVAAAALALIVFVGGNGVAYAATGNGLLKTVMVYFNGTGYEVNMEEKVDENGVTYYEGTYEVEDGEGYAMITDEVEPVEEGSYEISPYEISVDSVEVVEKDGKYFLVDGEIEIDITEDLADGEAAGSYEKDDVMYQYEVTGNENSWSVTVSGEE